jgi:DNA-binding YbaB/EbfC family protein
MNWNGIGACERRFNNREIAVETNPKEMMKARLQKLREHLAGLEVEGQSGAGPIKVTVNGKLDPLRVNIDPSLIKPEDAEKLETLIVAAFQMPSRTPRRPCRPRSGS